MKLADDDISLSGAQATLEVFTDARRCCVGDNAAPYTWLLPGWGGLPDLAQRSMFLDAALLMLGCPGGYLQARLRTV